jgi:hypothetical protein
VTIVGDAVTAGEILREKYCGEILRRNTAEKYCGEILRANTAGAFTAIERPA